MISLSTKYNIIYKALRQGLTIELYGNPLSLAAGAKAADIMKAADIISEEDFTQIAAYTAISEVENVGKEKY